MSRATRVTGRPIAGRTISAAKVAPTVGINPLDPMWIATLVGIVTVSSAGVAGVGGGATITANIAG